MTARPLLRPALAALPLLLAAALHPAPLAAQTATLVVAATDAETGEPLSGVRVRTSAGPGGATDAAGVARIALPAGRHAVALTRIGYEAVQRIVEVDAARGARLDAALAPEAVELGELRVEADADNAPDYLRSPLLRRFYRRAGRGNGFYFTRSQIDRIKPQDLGDLFRMVPGLRLRTVAETDIGHADAAGTDLVFRRPPTGPEECVVHYFVDGTPYQPPPGGIGMDIAPSEVEGVEVYRRAMSAPAEFRRSRQACSIILIWLREQI